MTRRRRPKKECAPRPDPPKVCSGCGKPFGKIGDYWADGRGGWVHTWCRGKEPGHVQR